MSSKRFVYTSVFPSVILFVGFASANAADFEQQDRVSLALSFSFEEAAETMGVKAPFRIKQSVSFQDECKMLVDLDWTESSVNYGGGRQPSVVSGRMTSREGIDLSAISPENILIDQGVIAIERGAGDVRRVDVKLIASTIEEAVQISRGFMVYTMFGPEGDENVHFETTSSPDEDQQGFNASGWVETYKPALLFSASSFDNQADQTGLADTAIALRQLARSCS